MDGGYEKVESTLFRIHVVVLACKTLSIMYVRYVYFAVHPIKVSFIGRKIDFSL